MITIKVEKNPINIVVNSTRQIVQENVKPVFIQAGVKSIQGVSSNPLGGLEGEFLRKASNADGDVEWKGITSLDLAPLSVSLAYNADSSISSVTKGGVVKTISYNTNGTIDKVISPTATKIFSYNADGSVSGVAVV